MQKIKVRILLVLIMMLMFSVTSHGAEILNVGVYDDKPMIFVDEMGWPQGLSIDVLEKIAEDKGYEINYIEGSFTECLKRLKNGEIDILPNLVKTKDRSKYLEFSEEFLIENWGVLITHKDTEIDSINKMNGMKVAIVKDDVDSGSFIQMALSFNLDVKYVEVEGYDEVISLINSKTADFGIINRFALRSYNEADKIKETPLVFSPSQLRYGYANNLDSRIIKTIDKEIMSMKSDPESVFYISIDKWFNDSASHKMAKELVYMIIGIALFSMFLVIKLILTKRSEKKKDNELQVMDKQLEAETVKSRLNEDKIYTMSYYDNLTGLGNKESLYRDLNELSIMEGTFALVFFDLDNLKAVNDSLGYIQGDRLIKTAVERLRALESDQCVMYRWGGDEFAYIFMDYKEVTQIETFAKKINTVFEEPINIEGIDFYITASIGISLYPSQAKSPEEIVKKATTSVHYVKNSGKNNYKIHTPELSDQLIEKVKLEKDIRKAIKNNEFLVYYQPRVDVDTNQIMGMEALVRWNSVDRGLVSPLEFIPLAEETGLIIDIDYMVMREACIQTKQWNDMGYDLSVSVNLSAKQFDNSGLIQSVEKIIKETGINVSNLEMEITESAVMENIESSILIIDVLKKMGIKVLLDDFGTGYSSLNYLKKLPLNILKIDKSFMDKVIDDSKERVITESVIRLAHFLGLQVVAEGIETEEQVEFLKENSCDEFQGYYFSKPVCKESFEELLKIEKVA